MNIVLWIIVSLAFLGSIFMFIPSIMAIASPRSGVEGGLYYWIDKVSKLFCALVMLYPLLFFVSILCYRFLHLDVLPWLVGYVFLLLSLFLIWSQLDCIKNKK